MVKHRRVQMEEEDSACGTHAAGGGSGTGSIGKYANHVRFGGLRPGPEGGDPVTQSNILLSDGVQYTFQLVEEEWSASNAAGGGVRQGGIESSGCAERSTEGDGRCVGVVFDGDEEGRGGSGGSARHAIW
eukprot:4515316-Ditylum_brightwellii.AAC.1